MSTILLATDGSSSSQAATEEAIVLAAATGWPLRVLVVWRTPSVVGYGYAPTTLLPELSHVEREHAQTIAEAAVERAHAAGADATLELREGEAAEQICAAAADLDVSLIVVGAHGWNTVKRFLFGSVSSRVLHDARCGVLVVPAAAAETEAA